jgi:hypothetical protein
MQPFTTEGSTMIEFRWIVLLTLWTLMIGPILDFTQSAPTAQATRSKHAPAAKSKNTL